jgi:hypothetical protein
VEGLVDSPTIILFLGCSLLFRIVPRVPDSFRSVFAPHRAAGRLSSIFCSCTISLEAVQSTGAQCMLGGSGE